MSLSLSLSLAEQQSKHRHTQGERVTPRKESLSLSTHTVTHSRSLFLSGTQITCVLCAYVVPVHVHNADAAVIGDIVYYTQKEARSDIGNSESNSTGISIVGV